MTEAYFTNRDEIQVKKPRRQKGQQSRKKRRCIVRITDGFFYKEVEYEDGEIVLKKKDISFTNPKPKIPRRGSIMKIYFACVADKSQQKPLEKAGAKNRLISYFYLRKKKPDVLRNIVETALAEHVERPDTKNSDDK